ncbi:hypothetical protein [Rhizobium leguminosarum]|uniref:hypothetical protein n=1 Tax=Rhizobium leguminosarum TaxID=384 RepID=UPI00160C82FF|nr:hypothetical protein [Rhizobium leguminosarum]MBB4465431.1 hypothetical protein [Rhizobium leguminosarum]MBB4472093.1 hypothetical protein [Rhizobium leguminosarum]
MSNETPPDDPSPKSAVITDNEFSFQRGAGFTVEGYTHTIAARNKFVGVGGEGVLFKASVDVPPPPSPEPPSLPEPLPTLQPEPLPMRWPRPDSK